MKKKTIGALAFAAVATLGLASCDDSVTKTAEPVNGSVNVYLSYQGKNGVTYRESAAWTSSVDGYTYTSGSLLPTWKAFGKNTGLDIKDVASYANSNDNGSYSAVDGQGFKTVDGQGIDLFYNTTSNINKMGNAGKAVDLYPEILAGNMPNLAQYLSDNPEVLSMIATYGADGTPHIYYTPYFDGYQSIERMFIMDTKMVENLLDSAATAGDTAAALGETRLGAAAYMPYVVTADGYNFAQNTDVTVALAADQTAKVTVKKTQNIINQQNAVLGTGATTTGAALLSQFKDYLTTAYGDSVGSGKTYSKLSELFVGQAACYNTDDLIALMRVVRANPQTASGLTACTEVETFFTRGEAANRIENVYDLASIWGVQGIDGESGNFYFDGDGNLVNLNGTVAAYDALDKLHTLYTEGLIADDFYNVPTSGASGTAGTNKYWVNSKDSSNKAGFMLYDYSASTTTGNDKDSLGIGTDASKRVGMYANVSRTGIRPVVHPLTYWNTGSSDNNARLASLTNKQLLRYAESNRALKNTSWCIPSTYTNKAGALKLMDYLYSAEGLRINDFGPIEYQGPTSATLIKNEFTPTLSQKLVQEYLTSGTDFWSFMRRYIGSTNGIGHVREDSLNLQVTNASAQVGQKYVDNAIKSGAVTLAKCVTADSYGFGACVPTSWSISISADDAKKYENLTLFWNASKTGDSGWRSIVIKGTGTDNSTAVDGTKTLKTVLNEVKDFNKVYTAAYARAINATPKWLEDLTATTTAA